jgi:FkbM family methyltransferase
MKTPVNQFHSGTGEGDAVTQHMLELRGHLRRLGHPSEIFGEFIPPSLEHEVLPIRSYHGDPDAILIVHHSMGHGAFEHVLGLSDRIVTLYHNITPDKFLTDETTRRFARIGREQLRILSGRSDAGVAVSNFNRKEMLDAGFRRVEVIPPRTDYSSFRRPSDQPPGPPTADWLFVGRLTENKCQHEVIRAFAAYARSYHPSARLLLVGDQSNVTYVDRLVREAERFGVADRVQFKGKLSADDLRLAYHGTGLFVCLSEHEGFGVPLLEAMAAELPVVALARAAIPETLGGAGVLLRDTDPWEVAALAKVILEDFGLHQRIVASQLERLRRIETFDIDGALQTLIDEVLTGVRPLRVQVQGPFETSYSLASINRHVALELARHPGFDVSIYATEGPGDYVPRQRDLEQHPEATALYQHASQVPYPDVVIRQMFPPRVADSPGGITCQCFAWEESQVPQEYVADFNRYLDGIGVPSSFVGNVLRESGVTVPIVVTGNGVAPHDETSRPRQPGAADLKGFRFLHISSGFPRKGVDVLLRAYFDRFTGDDDVSLILKTFPNPHNTIAGLLDELRSEHPKPPHVAWVDVDMSTDQTNALYNVASCYVHPARGEGFGLPVAEAMAARVPVITVAYSGLADFCSDETALTIPYVLTPARSHVSVPGSVWAEPDRDALGERMRHLFEDPSDPETQARIVRAYELVTTRYTWEAVGDRWCSFIHDLERQRKVPRVAMVTTWNSRCGIAEYSSYLVANMGHHVDVEIYADVRGEILSEFADVGVSRTWHSAWEPDLSELEHALDRSAADIVHIQFNFGFYDVARLAALIEKELALRPVVLTLHRTRDLVVSGQTFSLGRIAQTLEKVDCVIVHQPHDAELLDEMGIHARVEVIPHGAATVSTQDRLALRRAAGFGDRPVISTFGFLLPHKGTIELIRAVDVLRRSLPDILLVATCALHPDPMSAVYESECRAEIRGRSLQDNVLLITDFLPEAEAHAVLSATDLVVMPYKETEESASGALRFVLGAGRPVAAPPIPIFRDAQGVLAALTGTSPESLANDILGLLRDPERLAALGDSVNSFARSVSWSQVAARHRRLYETLLMQRQDPLTRKAQSNALVPSATVDPTTAAATPADPALATEEDVRACFRLLLGRVPSDTEWPGHATRAGGPLDDLVRSFMTSLEFQNRRLTTQTDVLTRIEIEGLVLYGYDDDPGSTAYLKRGVYEPHVTALVRRLLRPGAVFLDVGANLGYYTMVGASIVGPSGRVVAIEPSPRNVTAILAAIEANRFTCVDVRMLAAASTWRPLSFGSAGTNGMTGPLTDATTTPTIVQGAPLAAVLADVPPVDLVKIDVEGAEYDALDGYRALLARDRPMIIAEFGPPGLRAGSGVSGEQFLTLVLEHGYEVSVIDEDGAVDARTTDPADIMRVFEARGIDHLDIFFTPQS